MAKYVVTQSETDPWGEDMPSTKRFSNKGEAVAYLDAERTAGRFARLIYWDKGKWKEQDRVNPPLPT